MRRRPDLLGLGAVAGRLVEVTAHHGAHSPPERDVPAVDRLPEPLGDPGEPFQLDGGRFDVTDLEQGHQPDPATQQFQLPVTGLPSQPYDLGRLREPGIAAIGPGHGVACPASA